MFTEDSQIFKDEHRHKVWESIHQHDLRAFSGLLTDDVFSEAAKVAGVSLGCSALSLVKMVWLGISGAIHVSRNFADMLQLTLKLLEDASDWHSAELSKANSRPKKAGRKGNKANASKARKCSKHDPHGTSATNVTEEAFTQARGRRGPPMIAPGSWRGRK